VDPTGSRFAEVRRGGGAGEHLVSVFPALAQGEKIVLVPVSSPIRPALGQLADLARWDAELESVLLASSLVGRLSQVPDRRKRRGLRHSLLVVLALSAWATPVVGNDSVTAIRQWAARTSQEVLERVGARRDPLRGRFLVPSERTLRRVFADLADCVGAPV
jgi:hypothetical protein